MKLFRIGLVLMLAVVSANAQLVNVDFGFAGPGMATMSGLAAAPDVENGGFWNGVNETTVLPYGLKDSTGEDTSITVSVGGAALWANASWNPYQLDGALLNDYVIANGAAATVEIAGLVPGGQYKIYVYSSVGAKPYWWPAEITPNDTLWDFGTGITKNISGAETLDAAPYFNEAHQGVVWDFFEVTANENGIILGSFVGGPNGHPDVPEGYMDGIQIQAIPEPATVSLIVLGFASLLRKRNA